MKSSFKISLLEPILHTGSLEMSLRLFGIVKHSSNVNGDELPFAF